MNGLWGEAFKLPDKKDTKKLLKKVETPKKEVSSEKTIRKQIKSTKISDTEKLSLIYEEVNRVLGTYKDATTVLETEDQVRSYFDSAIKNNIIAVDIESNHSLDPLTGKLMGVCVYTPTEKQAYIPLNHTTLDGILLTNQVSMGFISEQLTRLKDVYTIFHNGKFDIKFIKCTTGVELPVHWDTMIGSRILNELEKAGLKEQYIQKIDPSIEKYSIEHLFQNVPYEIVDPKIFALYAATDSFMTYKLYEYQKKQFELPGNEKLYDLFLNIEMPLVPVVAQMELNGLCIDQDYSQRLSKKYHDMLDKIDSDIDVELKKYEPKIIEFKNSSKSSVIRKGSKTIGEQIEIPVNLGSPLQLGILIYDVLGYKSVSTKSPMGTGEEILLKLIDKYPDFVLGKLILEKRGILKLLSTYIDKLPECISPVDGKIHASFGQVGTDTGRMSCISKGTLVSCPGGDVPIEEVVPGSWVYCYDDIGNLKLSRVKKVWYTGDRDCLKLSWKSKYNHSLTGELICTPDHFIKTKRGWVMAKDLTPEDSIYYVHRRKSDKSMALSAFRGQGNEEEHIWIKENHFRMSGKDFPIHHKDRNRFNNDPDNLQITTPKSHDSLHRSDSDYSYGHELKYSRDQLIELCKSVNWEISKIPHDYECVISWLQKYRINYILGYLESYPHRPYYETKSGVFSKKLSLPMNKRNLKYALELSSGNTVLASTYFGVTESQFIKSCDKYELLSNYNITAIEFNFGTYSVYDLEVENFHNFIAGELCVHNCTDPNLQNIPSKNYEIRMMFKAGYRYDTIEGDSEFKVYFQDEVETTSGYVIAESLRVGNGLKITEDGITEIVSIKTIVREGNYIVFTV